MAWRRLVRSSSSTSSSESRVTRNCENASTGRSPNSDSRWARITLVSSTKACIPGAQMAAGSLITRGNARGTLTIAIEFSRPNASCPPSLTMKLSDLLATCGNGCAGSSPTGSNSGCTWVSKNRATQARCSALRSAWLITMMPSRCSAGITSSLKTAYFSSIRPCASAATWRNWSRCGSSSPVALRIASSAAAKRTSKNSSMLDETMVM